MATKQAAPRFNPPAEIAAYKSELLTKPKLADAIRSFSRLEKLDITINRSTGVIFTRENDVLGTAGEVTYPPVANFLEQAPLAISLAKSTLYYHELVEHLQQSNAHLEKLVRDAEENEAEIQRATEEGLERQLKDRKIQVADLERQVANQQSEIQKLRSKA